MTLTHEDLTELKKPFPVHEHEFDYAKNCYITEYAITERLDSIDPAWSLLQTTLENRQELGTEGKLIVTVALALTVKGVTRTGIGRGIVELRKDKKGEANQAEKTGATDALKRAARLFGIGRYLLTLPKNIDNHADLEKWLNGGTQSTKWTDNLKQMEWLKGQVIALRKAVGDKHVDTAKGKLNTEAYTEAKLYFAALSAKATELQGKAEAI